MMEVSEASQLAGWFSSAGPEVQAALIGNAGIVLAALLTVSGTAIFALSQLKQEREEKSRDRALEIKKEILFESVRGASGALASLGSLNDLFKPLKDISSDFQKNISHITVAMAVGDIETVERGRDLLSVLGPSFIKIVVARKPLEDMHKNIQGIQNNMDSQLEENRLILNIQRDAIANGDRPRAEQAQEMFLAGKALFERFSKQRDDAIDEIAPLEKIFIADVAEMRFQAEPTFRSYVAAVRKDIDIDKGSSEPFMSAAYIDPDGPRKILKDALDKLS